MCGIVGALSKNAQKIVLEGLSRLEYRGYDSAGLAVQSENGTVHTRKATGKLAALRAEIEQNPLPAAALAIGHTRWATHGSATTVNAHPHSSHGPAPKVTVVHNGIIENYEELKAELKAEGYTFVSETDTETLPCLLSWALAQGQSEAEALALLTTRCRGNYAVLAVVEGAKGTRLLATRRGAPLCLGLGKGGENFVASDPLALASVTDKFVYLEDNDTVVITPEKTEVRDASGTPVTRPVQVLNLADDMAGKQGYKHFMLKEMMEQPAVAARILEAYTKDGEVQLPLTAAHAAAPAITIVACGTAYYAGMVGGYMLEELAEVPTQADVASEMRYRKKPYPKGGLMIVVSQSGETADTLAALEHAKAAGQTIIALTNVTTSSIARAAHVVIDLMAGREVAVASTKAFLAMVLVLQLVALKLAALNGQQNAATVASHLKDIHLLPMHLMNILAEAPKWEPIAEKLASAKNPTHSMLYLARGMLTPLAYEGALKMKEITYIHAEGYASGEMKHGPIALVDETLPVVNIAASNDGLFEKTISNLKEVEARHGQIILIVDEEGAKQLSYPSPTPQIPGSYPAPTHPYLIITPSVPRLLLPYTHLLPLQFLAYQTAVFKGTDVDQPRNLAKSVTVE